GAECRGEGGKRGGNRTRGDWCVSMIPPFRFVQPNFRALPRFLLTGSAGRAICAPAAYVWVARAATTPSRPSVPHLTRMLLRRIMPPFNHRGTNHARCETKSRESAGAEGQGSRPADPGTTPGLPYVADRA